MAKQMTPEQLRRKQIKQLREQVKDLKKEEGQRHRIADEKAELKRLMEQVHPSKLHKLAEIAGKRPHINPEKKKKIVSALKALKKAGREFNKVRAEIRAYGQRER